MSQCIAKSLAAIEQDASGGVTIGAGFQKKYIVDPGSETDKQEWFDVLGGQIIRKTDGLHRFGVEALKKAKAGASTVAAQAHATRGDILGEDTGDDLNLEMLTAGDREVLQVCVDNDVKSCAGIAAPGKETDPESGDPFIDIGSEGLQLLRTACLFSNPAFFCAPIVGALGESTVQDNVLDYPVEVRPQEKTGFLALKLCLSCSKTPLRSRIGPRVRGGRAAG